MARESQKDRIERCLQAVEDDPKVASAHFNLGLAYTASARIKLAEEAYSRALELDPEFVEAWVNLGGIRLMRWDFDGCLEANQRAAALDPSSTRAHFNMGQAYLYKNDPENLLACTQRVLELDRDHAAAHYFAAVAMLALDDMGAAERHLGRAMELGHTPPPDFVKAMEKAQLARAQKDKVTLFEITGAHGPETEKED